MILHGRTGCPRCHGSGVAISELRKEGDAYRLDVTAPCGCVEVHLLVENWRPKVESYAKAVETDFARRHAAVLPPEKQ